MAGGAAEVLLVSLSCPLPLLKTQPLSLLVCCIFFRRDGPNQYSPNQYSIQRLELNLFSSEKRGGKSHLGIVLVLAELEIYWYWLYLRILGSRNGICLGEGGIPPDPVSCPSS